MKSDLDQLAINTMKHELCNSHPCRECKPPTYSIYYDGKGYRVCIIEGSWSGTSSYSLPNLFKNTDEAVAYAERWLEL